MKRIISTVLVLLICLTMTAGCAKKDDGMYDYDVTKYITLGDYVGIEYEEQTLTVTDEDIDSYINSALSEKGYGEETEITDRAVQNGDTVNIDYVGTKDGVAFSGGTAEGSDLVIGSNSFIDGFESGLIGAKKGQTLDLNLTFPEDYHTEELAGADVVFTVTVNSITATVYPEFTDALAKELSEEYPTVEQYRSYAAQQLAEENEQTLATLKENSIWSSVIENAELKSYPDGELDYCKDIVIKNYDSIAYQQSGMTYEELLAQYNMTLEDEEIATELNAQAESLAKNYLVIVAIARDQDLDITDEDYNAALESYATENGYSSTAEFEENIDKKQFYLMLLNEKVTEFIVENATLKK